MNPQPHNWEMSSLGAVANDISYGFTTTSTIDGSGAKLLRITDIQEGKVNWSTVPHCAELPRATYLLRPGDIVIARTGATTGKSFLIEELSGEAVYASYLIRVRVNEVVEPKYLFSFLQSNDYWSQIQLISKGTAQPGANATILSQVRVPIPPLSEQRRIVAKIDSLSAKSGRARNHLDHLPRLVEKYKQAVLTAAFRGGLTRGWRSSQEELEPVGELLLQTPPPVQSRGGREATTSIQPGVAALSINDPGTQVPEGWAWVSLRRVARQETGHTPSRSHPEYWGGRHAWIGIRDAGDHHGRIISDTLQTVTDAGLENSSARILPKDTVCLSRTASVGYVTIMGRPMATSQDFATWTCTAALHPKYLMYALLAEGDNIRAFGKGSTHTTIYFPEIRALNICLAPLGEQREIIRRVENALAWIDHVASETTNARKLIDHLDQAVLAEAFRGELVRQDPSDEPANVLLERIRAERATPQRSTGARGRPRTTRGS